MIRPAQSDEEIARCYPVMAQLRPHLEADAFVARVRRQETDGYRLALAEDGTEDGGGAVVAATGYRVFECLHSGRTLYVDDLVTDSARRGEGWGRRMLEWLAATARTEGCAALTLDSGVQRHDAHRFYLRERMRISAHHFDLDLRP